MLTEIYILTSISYIRTFFFFTLVKPPLCKRELKISEANTVQPTLPCWVADPEFSGVVPIARSLSIRHSYFFPRSFLFLFTLHLFFN